MKLIFTLVTMVSVSFCFAQSPPFNSSPVVLKGKAFLNQKEDHFKGRKVLKELTQIASPPEKNANRSTVTKMALDSIDTFSKNTSGTYEFASRLAYNYGYNEEVLSQVGFSKNAQGVLDTTEARFYTYDAFIFMTEQVYYTNAWMVGLQKEEKYEYSYDSHHNLTGQTHLQWDSSATGGWVNMRKDTWNYNSVNALTNYEVLAWNDNNMSWEIISRETYGYDSNGNEIQREIWDVNSGSLMIKNRIINTLDANNKVIESIWSQNSSNPVVWDSQFRVQYTYSGDLLMSEIYSKNQGVSTPWELDSKYERLYVNDNNTEIQEYFYESGAWFWSGHIKMEYNNQGDIVKNMWDVRVYPSTTWETFALSTLEYDYVNHINSEIFHELSSTTQQFEPARKFSYDYDDLGNVEGGLFQYWNEQTNSWGGNHESSYRYTYDNNYVRNELVKSPYRFMYSMKLLEINSQWNDSANMMVDHTKKEFHWSPIVVNTIEEPTALEGKVYPNPATQILNIEVDNEMVEFQLYDVQGKLMMTQSLNGTSQVDINQLISGIYIYTLSSDNKVKQGILIKE